MQIQSLTGALSTLEIDFECNIIYLYMNLNLRIVTTICSIENLTLYGQIKM